MDGSEKNFAANLQKDIDAISWYGMGSSSPGQTFLDMATKCEAIMTKLGGQAALNNIGLVPTLTTGRYCNGRIDTAVSWIAGDPNAEDDKDKPYQGKWTEQPTMAELEAHIANVYEYVQANFIATTPNMILSYAWNEHDEGGWLCPTIAVDENGTPLYNEDGTIKINTERIDTLKKTLETLNAPEETPVVTPTVAPVATPGDSDNTEALPKPTPGSDAPSKESTFNILDYWWILPIAVVAIGGAVALVIKKKK